jgi:hypothetical protein
LARHYAAILGQDIQTPAPKTHVERAALELARCDAMLDRAQAHHTSLQPVFDVTEYKEIEDQIIDVFEWPDAEFEVKVEAMQRLMRVKSMNASQVKKSKRLAERYLKEAHASRSRALNVYLEAQDINLPKFANY